MNWHSLTKLTRQTCLYFIARVAFLTFAQSVSFANDIQNESTNAVQNERAPASTTLAQPSRARKANVLEQANSNPALASEGTQEKDESSGLFGDWFGAKTKIKNWGLDTQIKYKSDVIRNFSGGEKAKNEYLGNLDVTADFDIEKIADVKGLNLFIYGLGNYGGKPTEYIGDSFGSSNIQAPNTFKLYEAYLKKTLDNHFTGIFGLRDLNADYNSTSTSSAFINSAFGISPSLSQTGVNGPSIFPTTSLAATIKYESPNSFYFQSGVFNAKSGNPDKPHGTHINSDQSEGYLYIWESGFSDDQDDKQYKYSAGVWTYSKAQETIDANKGLSQNNGAYLLADQSLTQKISTFIKFGHANAKVNTFSSSLETGITYQGLIPGRPDDKLAAGFARARLSGDYKALNNSTDEESVLELNYQAQLGRGISVTLDYQYIQNPGAIENAKNVQVGIIRIEVMF